MLHTDMDVHVEKLKEPLLLITSLMLFTPMSTKHVLLHTVVHVPCFLTHQNVMWISRIKSEGNAGIYLFYTAQVPKIDANGQINL